MSAFKHPLGPRSRGVYWRRRLIVLIGLIAIVAVVVLIVARPGVSSGEDTKTPVETTSTPAATSTLTSSSNASGQQCKPTDVKVEAVTDAASYAADALPQLSVALTNTGSEACLIDAGTGQQVFTILSGSEVYWRSTDCQSSKVDAEVLLQPGATVSSQTPITWDRTRSAPATCQAERQPVPGGGASYHLQVSVAGITSETTKQFQLQ